MSCVCCVGCGMPLQVPILNNFWLGYENDISRGSVCRLRCSVSVRAKLPTAVQPMRTVPTRYHEGYDELFGWHLGQDGGRIIRTGFGENGSRPEQDGQAPLTTRSWPPHERTSTASFEARQSELQENLNSLVVSQARLQTTLQESVDAFRSLSTLQETHNAKIRLLEGESAREAIMRKWCAMHARVICALSAACSRPDSAAAVSHALWCVG